MQLGASRPSDRAGHGDGMRWWFRLRKRRSLDPDLEDEIAFHRAMQHEMFNDDIENFKPFSVWELSKANAGKLAQVEYLIVVGDQDQEYKNNVRFHEFLSSIGIKHQFVVLPGFGHYGPR